MRTRGSESFIVLPLLPIFLIGVFPMLLLSLLGPAGLIILGILVASAGLTDILDANSTFSEQIIVHGYARGSERTGQRTALRSEMRFASVMIAAGAGLAVAGIGWSGAVVRASFARLEIELRSSREHRRRRSRTRRLRTPQKFEHGRAARRQCRRVPQ